LKQGIINVLHALAGKCGMGREEYISQIATIVHGTTQGTNTILMRSGPKIGTIGTEGHTDVLQLRRVTKEDMWDWRMPFPQPLVPRYLRLGVKERVTSTGEVLIPLDEDDVHKAVAYLKKMGVGTIVVNCIFSFLNPAHEKRIGEIIKEDYPEAHVTLSHEVAHIIGEYERFNTAVIDAYIRPAISDYIESLEKFLEGEGFKGRLYFMQNNGGVEATEVAIARPGTLALSGPAAGPTAALEIGRLHGEKNLLSVDMGGTSFDIAIIDKGKSAVKTENVICDHRFSLPVVEVNTLGAGGGSIAWFDLGGTLRVGPKSAGADPGPACYGTGGEEATVTDADVILGYISPDYFLGGEMKLDRSLAEKAIKEKVANRLGISVQEAAAAIYKVSNSVMADGATHVFIQRGYDPRDFILVAAGAAGPLCALRIAQDLGMKRVLIPKFAPIYCAFGMLGVDLKHDFMRYHRSLDSELDIEIVKGLYKEMEEEGMAILNREGVPENKRSWTRSMRLRYYGQFRDVEVEWPSGPITKEAIAKGIDNFHKRHKELYGSANKNYPLDIMGFGLAAIGSMPRIKIGNIPSGSSDCSAALKGERDAYFEESNGFVKTRVYDGDKMLTGNVLEGPCIVEQRMTNVVIPPTFKMLVDEYGNYSTI
jgi:N-methylhydantoinase A